MVTNFENITYELTEEEIRLVPDMCEAFRKYTKENPIKGAEICTLINEKRLTKSKFCESRLRKIVNHIRVNQMIPLIADVKGYYVDYDVSRIKSQAKSLRDRAHAILRVSEAMEGIADKMSNGTTGELNFDQQQ